ncbi:MAG: (2Fe-2S)-binding protein [Acholeplasmataceae bacterium]|jgi:bacterioferritin-associated ferredoxin|nr:(2Fe-2S)-binding protein [Acholeplasmataceae bacterium]
MNPKDVIICRCEDLSLADLFSYFEQGYTDMETLKRLLRIGMGPCQGNTCLQLVQRELSKYLNKKLEDIPTPTIRPLTMGVKIKSVLEGEKDES